MTKEFYDQVAVFERIYSNLRLDKEDKKLWRKKQFYQNGETNKLFIAFLEGFAMAKHMAIMGKFE